MDLLEKLEPILIFSAIILGLLFNNATLLQQISPSLITIFLSLMLFALFLDIPLSDIRNSFSNITSRRRLENQNITYCTYGNRRTIR